MACSPATAPHPVSTAAAATHDTVSTAAPAVAAGVQVETAAPHLPQRIDIPGIDRLLESALVEGKLPGAVVTVGRSSGVVFQRAYGHRSLLPAKTPMTTDVIFDLASLTKPLVTASTVMILVERGMLRLNDPVSQHIPELQGSPGGDITLLQLLLHSSGLPSVNPLEHFDNDHDDAVRALLAVRPGAQPGARYLYSDVGYLWLGEIVERVTKAPLDVFARETLFAPLDLQDTFFKPPIQRLDRIAPTEVADDRTPALIHGVVHDPRAFRLGGVAGHAGLFSTADNLALIARALLSGGTLNGVRILSQGSVQTMTRPHFIGDTVRTPGWDVGSGYSRHRGTRLSPTAFGHGGYTGVTLWVDPALDLFVLFLSNRVHPSADGDIIDLAGAVADEAVAAVAAVDAQPVCPPSDARVLTGIDVLRRDHFELLRGKRVGLVTHLAATTRDGTPTLDVLARAPAVNVAAIFTPEHGLESKLEGAIADSRDGERNLPIRSLYGKTKRPTAAMLADIDVLVVDLIDVGVRFYTYASTLHQVMLAAAEHGLPVIVLDRPNPLGGLAVEGPMLDSNVRNFVNYHRLPVRHGLTLGELAGLVAAEDSIGVALSVVPAEGWRRGTLGAETALPFRAPSPNLRSHTSTLLYPAVGLLESTNVSVGRGTDAPFEQLGAPWLDHRRLVTAVVAEGLPGVTLTPIEFTPDAAPHRGELCKGVHFEVTDPHTFRPVDTALGLARALADLHPTEWNGDDLQRMLGNALAHRALLNRAEIASVKNLYAADLEAFKARRARFLRYPACDASESRATEPPRRNRAHP